MLGTAGAAAPTTRQVGDGSPPASSAPSRATRLDASPTRLQTSPSAAQRSGRTCAGMQSVQVYRSPRFARSEARSTTGAAVPSGAAPSSRIMASPATLAASMSPAARKRETFAASSVANAARGLSVAPDAIAADGGEAVGAASGLATARCNSATDPSFSGASRKIRTSDPRLRRPMLYPAELWTPDAPPRRSIRAVTREPAFRLLRRTCQARRSANVRNPAKGRLERRSSAHKARRAAIPGGMPRASKNDEAERGERRRRSEAGPK